MQNYLDGFGVPLPYLSCLFNCNCCPIDCVVDSKERHYEVQTLKI